MEKLLIIGGTQFIGRNLLLKLQELNLYDITLFNRGQTNADLFPEYKRLTGDRNTNDVLQIGEQEWDYIIDLSCYYPDSIRQILRILKNKPKRYVFVSTCSVYDSQTHKSDSPTPEDGILLACTKEQETEALPAAYGNKKVACEQLLTESGLDHIILRPSLVYGPYDHTDRLYYWLYQTKYKNPILLPDKGERTFSITYVDDLVNAIIASLPISKHSNIYNVISQQQVSIKKIVDTASPLLQKNPTVVNAPPSFLHEQKIQQWTNMPLWIDGDYFSYAGKKLKTDFDLSLSNWQTSIVDTIAHYNDLNWQEPIYGIPEKQRLELISKLCDE